jgi:two-component system, OmpR family, response regulator
MLLPDHFLGAVVLVVEDDESVRERVAEILSMNGFVPRCASTRDAVLAELAKGELDAIVLDLSLPGDDGIQITKAVRGFSEIPILMLTGRAGVRARVTGLDAGADDYLVKPFSDEELAARLRAILRRSRRVAAQIAAAHTRIMIGDAMLDLGTGVLKGPVGTARCTERESRLLHMLARSGGRMSRESIYRDVFGREWDPADRSLDVHVARLRSKLDAVSGSKGMIRTLRAQGYELRASVSVVEQDGTLKPLIGGPHS